MTLRTRIALVASIAVAITVVAVAATNYATTRWSCVARSTAHCSTGRSR